MKTLRTAASLALLAAGLAAGIARGQTQELTLTCSRDWGYGGFGNDIQGVLTLKAAGPADMIRVEFFIDGSRMGEVTQAPFSLQFVTDDYPVGEHSLRARGFRTGGEVVESPPLTLLFVTAEQGASLTLGLVIPILAVVFGVMILAAIVPWLAMRKIPVAAPGVPRQYPLRGGLCPKCERPAAYPWFGFNLITGKIFRCPYCGQWGLFRRASIEQLRAAEQTELAAAAPRMPEPSADEKLRRELDESKYLGG